MCQSSRSGRRLFAQGTRGKVLESDGVNDTAETPQDDSAAKAARPSRPWYIELPLTLITVFVIVFVIQTFIGRVYLIPSASMEPTLHGCSGCQGDRIAVEKISYYFSDPAPGDVVVFKGTDSWNRSFVSQRSDNPIKRGLENLGAYAGLVAPDENNLVKRIVATGGQTVSCQAGDPAVMVDGSPIDQDYVLDPPQIPVNTDTGSVQCGGEYFGPVRVPDGNVFVMGDNRTNSADSRAPEHMGDEYQGTIPVESIRGKAVARIWPVGRIGGIGSPDIQHH